ncbi:MAG: BON domain-containing protein [Planctomycetaceae bacterium]|nr:BON domain-containing protein [Planctomycetaceae bacterium]
MKRSPSFPTESNHSLETRVRHDLMAHPEMEFSSLVVHRIPDGVCLEGVVSTSADRVDVCQLVKEVAGVNSVLNHLVIQEAQPKKG